MTSPATKQALILLTFAVWAAAVVVKVNGIKLTARAPVTIQLATKPSSVRVTVDGEKQAGGAYLQTPTSLTTPPGRHRLKISRDGYVAHVMTVEGDPGEAFKMEDIVLQALPEARFVTVEVQVQAALPMYVEIDEGHDAGQAPLTSEDLEEGKPHTLVVYPAWPEREPRFTCKFTPPAAPALTVTTEAPAAEGSVEVAAPEAPAPYRIKVVKDKKRFTATGCTPVKPKK
jgi:hypothetical protein